MLVAVALLCLTPSLELTTAVPLPGRLSEVTRVPGVADDYYVMVVQGKKMLFLRANLASGSTKPLSTFDFTPTAHSWPTAYLDASGYVREQVVHDSGAVEEDIQYRDLETGRVYAVGQIRMRGPRIQPPFRFDTFPGPRIPRGSYLLDDGPLVEIEWDSEQGRFGHYYKPEHAFGVDYSNRIEFEPGTWKTIPLRTDGANRYGAEGGLSGNRHAQPNVEVIMHEQMSRDTTTEYWWRDANARPLPYSGSALDDHLARWYAGGFYLKDGRGFGGIRCLDRSFGKELWRRPWIQLGSSQVERNVVVPYCNGSWIGSYLVGVATPKVAGGNVIVLLNGDTGRTIFRLPMQPSDSILAITDSYLLLGRRFPERLERWDLKGN
jgi:hypothetical protein